MLGDEVRLTVGVPVDPEGVGCGQVLPQQTGKSYFFRELALCTRASSY